MDSQQQIDLLNMGVGLWNEWRRSDRHVTPDLNTADLISQDLRGIDFSASNLCEVNFTRSNLNGANLSGADLTWADLTEADLSYANLDRAKLQNAIMYRARLGGATLRGADLTKANLVETRLSADLAGATLAEADLTEADLVGADLRDAVLPGANLSGARLIHTNFERANLNGCRVYGAAVWDVNLADAEQRNLIIDSESGISVDDLEVAQFIYLLLNRKKLRNVLEALTSKAVLILGRFKPPERKLILDAIADELRKYDLLPLIFDFDRATDRDFTETIKILAGLSLFVIVDLTNPSSVPQELMATVPDYEIPFVPILEEGQRPYSMFADLMKHDWVLKPVVAYATKESLLSNFKHIVLDRAWKKHQELRRKTARRAEVMTIDQMLAPKE